MEWTKSDTLKFIQMLQEFPCLWQVKSADYKNRLKRRDALMTLAQGMGMEVTNIEKKILSLKTQYNRELHKIKTKSGSDPEDAYQSNWYAFEYLRYIKDSNAPRCSSDSFTVSIDNDEEFEEDYIIDQKNVTIAADPIAIQTNDEMLMTPSETEHQRPNKRKCDSSVLNALQEASTAIINRSKKDEFSVFGDYVASELRQLNSDYHILKLKRDVTMLIYDTKLKIMEKMEKQ